MCNLPVLVTKVREGQDSDSSDGKRSPIEAKVRLKDDDLKQVVGQAVVSSFINHSRHPNQTAMIPSIGLAKGEIVAALYDCRSDILLVLHPPIEWFSTGRKLFDVGGLVVLWALLHHKLFVKEKTCKSFGPTLVYIVAQRPI